jgi:hypothetical protein
MPFRNAAVIAAILVLPLVLGSVGPGSSAFGKERTIRVSESERAACMPDAMKLCRSALPNVYKVLVCFRNHRSKISSGCNAVLAGYGF